MEGMTIRQRYKGIYIAWKNIRQRCMNPRCKPYKNYGGRGIMVCPEWENFETFLEWSLNNGYRAGLDIDRINNNGNYEPSNCRWVTRRENLNNRRNTIFIKVGDEILPDTVWAERLGIDRALIKYWIRSHDKEYASLRLKDIQKNGYTPSDFGFSHRKEIKHVESGRVFGSVRDAARAFGIAPCTISNAMRENRSTGKGRFQWTDISDK